MALAHTERGWCKTQVLSDVTQNRAQITQSMAWGHQEGDLCSPDVGLQITQRGNLGQELIWTLAQASQDQN